MTSPGRSRPEWDEYFMRICHVVATRSTCLRRHVGALLVKDRRILTTGYNGPPKGMAHCEELGGCYRDKHQIPSGQRQELCRALHAEQNAILQAAVHGVALDEGITCYCTNLPCVTCAKMLLNTNVTRIVYEGDYPDALAREMLHEAGVELCRRQPSGDDVLPCQACDCDDDGNGPVGSGDLTHCNTDNKPSAESE